MSALTPEFFNTLIYVVIIIGLALAVVRLYADFTRPLPPQRDPERTETPGNDEDTKPNKMVTPDENHS